MLGLLFDDDCDNILLLQQRSVTSMLGVRQGMYQLPSVRIEEIVPASLASLIGVDPEWSHFLTLRYYNSFLHFYAARDEVAFMDARTASENKLVRIPVAVMPSVLVVPYLRWVIPMGRHHLLHETIRNAAARIGT